MKKVIAKDKNIKAEAKKAVVKTTPVVEAAVEKKEVQKEEKKEAAVKEAVAAEPAKEEPAVEKKPAVKKTAEKKTTTTRKKAAPAVTEEVFIQVGNQELSTAGMVEKVKAAYIAEGHSADSITKVRAYVKPEENMIYYVVNDDYASGISLF